MKLFVPRADNHSLVEAVFGFVFEKHWAPEQFLALKQNHDVWKEHLPRSNDVQQHQVTFGPTGILIPQFVPASGVIFDRVKPDGTIALRLSFENNTVFFNCLTYTRWADIWPLAQDVLSKSLSVVASVGGSQAPLIAREIIYQTIDVFGWHGGKDQYDVSELLNVDGEYVPRRLLGGGSAWHLYQGWFEKWNNLDAGALLNRIHFDAVNEPTIEVRMDSTLALRLENGIRVLNGDGSLGDACIVFDKLHESNKSILKKFLSQAMIKKINLG
ncbi:TIGR04255 family protein [Rhodobacter viridis]|uniref:TIGR04255 family protein n=1 Tax=Rhodobacter viridis TaxID=1054202 RepID=UPI000DA1E88F|nr:TIGR04255 family protein [Rhodobacter viridis]